MKHFVVHPRSRRGWCLALAFALLISAGIWPVVAAFNRAELWFGLPPLAVLTYAIVTGCWLTMLIANRLLRRSDSDV
ncbi:hypothetical protein [Salinicola halophilus]|uniref:hypothetical protein n=1 Tax=Salinicola halophilus TaxID=184065 RepID=UPI000DA21A3E|nr:hypothetical protein [Salinicola halophilus]